MEPDDKQRFCLELEFVQCLANPSYLNCEWVFHEERGGKRVCLTGWGSLGGPKLLL